VIYSNIHLYKIPYYFIRGINHLNDCHDGFICADEFWSICDSRASITKKNKIVSDILLRSRKRGLIYSITAQLLELVDKRVRKLVDFSSYPLLSRNETLCKVNVFRTGYPKAGTWLNTMYYRTANIMQMFNTNEELDMEEVDENPMEIRFQENHIKGHKDFCACEECKGRTFETWEQADAVAEEYWKKRFETEPNLVVF
jgi:hypothetical protein